jgi:aspartokinase/homoserine dehydrogenase 1
LKCVAEYQGVKQVLDKAYSCRFRFLSFYGKDNIVLFYTQPLSGTTIVVKGAGAGADVTASGVLQI